MHILNVHNNPRNCALMTVMTCRRQPCMSTLLQANGSAAHVKAETPPVAKPIPAIASVKAEPVPQTAKGDDGKEFLYATKVSQHNCHA